MRSGWNSFLKHQGVLTLQITAAGTEPQLRNHCDSLLKKLRSAATSQHANKEPLMDCPHPGDRQKQRSQFIVHCITNIEFVVQFHGQVVQPSNQRAW